MRQHAAVPVGSGTRSDASRPQRVLVAVDFGAASLAAASWVSRHLLPDGELVLAHVLPVPEAPAFLQRNLRSPETLVRTVSEPMRGGLEGLAATLGSRRVQVELAAGDPAEELARLAASCGVDLVCVGRSRSRGQTAELGRTTVDRLLRRLRVPLLQVASGTDGVPGSILAAMDGGPASASILALAADYAARLEAQLTVIHVLDERVRAYTRAMEVAAGSASRADAAEETLWSDAADWLAAALERTGMRRSRAHAMVSLGDPGEQVLAASRRAEAELIVVGRSGRDATAPGAVGSTTRLVLRQAECPVLVVPDAPPSGRPGERTADDDTRSDESDRVEGPAEALAGESDDGWHRRLTELSPADLLDALHRGRALPYVVPAVLDLVAADPLASAGMFPGDLLRGLLEVDSTFWSRHPRLYARYREALRAGAASRRALPPEQRLDFWLRTPDPLPAREAATDERQRTGTRSSRSKS